MLVPAPLRIERLLRDGLATFGGLAQSKGVVLRAEPLPAAVAELRVMADARRLQQCLNNGISNALKFTERGGVVTIRAFLPAPSAADAADGEVEGAEGGGPAAGGQPAAGPRASPAARSRTAAAATIGSGGRRCGGEGNGGGGCADAAAGGAGGAGGEGGGERDDGGGGAAPPMVRVHIAVTDNGIGLSDSELRTLQHGDLFSQVGRSHAPFTLFFFHVLFGFFLSLSVPFSWPLVRTRAWAAALRGREAGPGLGVR